MPLREGERVVALVQGNAYNISSNPILSILGWLTRILAILLGCPRKVIICVTNERVISVDHQKVLWVIDARATAKTYTSRSINIIGYSMQSSYIFFKGHYLDFVSGSTAIQCKAIGGELAIREVIHHIVTMSERISIFNKTAPSISDISERTSEADYNSINEAETTLIDVNKGIGKNQIFTPKRALGVMLIVGCIIGIISNLNDEKGKEPSVAKTNVADPLKNDTAKPYDSIELRKFQDIRKQIMSKPHLIDLSKERGNISTPRGEMKNMRSVSPKKDWAYHVVSSLDIKPFKDKAGFELSVATDKYKYGSSSPNREWVTVPITTETTIQLHEGNAKGVLRFGNTVPTSEGVDSHAGEKTINFFSLHSAKEIMFVLEFLKSSSETELSSFAKLAHEKVQFTSYSQFENLKAGNMFGEKTSLRPKTSPTNTESTKAEVIKVEKKENYTSVLAETLDDSMTLGWNKNTKTFKLELSWVQRVGFYSTELKSDLLNLDKAKIETVSRGLFRGSYKLNIPTFQHIKTKHWGVSRFSLDQKRLTTAPSTQPDTIDTLNSIDFICPNEESAEQLLTEIYKLTGKTHKNPTTITNVSEFVLQFYESGASQTKLNKKSTDFYASLVTYFGKSKSLAMIKKDQIAYEEKWTNRIFVIDPNDIKIEKLKSEDLYSVTTTFSIKLENNKEILKGKRSGELLITDDNGRLSIVSINSKLIGKDIRTIKGSDPIILTKAGGSAGYIKDLNGVLIWNNKPMPNESAKWIGKSINGFASGEGRLIWYKAGKFTLDYQGLMINGKLHGKTKCTDSNGDISIRYWNHGVKAK